jgi:tetratricopeptide (TPR) repeat protein
MPSLQDIEKFKTQLDTLGSEPEILAEQGEAIEDPPPPQEGLPTDLSDLFAGAGPAPGAAEAEAPGMAARGGAHPAEEAQQAPGGELGEEEFDFSSLFGLEGAEGLDTLEAPPAGPEAEAGEAPAPEEPFFAEPAAEGAVTAEPPTEQEEAAKALEDFGIPSDLLESLEKGQGPAAEAEGEAPAEGALGEAPPAEGEEIVDFSLPADFGVHEEGAGEAAGGEVFEDAGEGPGIPVEAGEQAGEFPEPSPFAAEAPAEFTLPAMEEPAAPAPAPAAAAPEAAGAFGEELTPPAEAFGEEAFQLPEDFLAPTAGEQAPGEGAGEAPPEMPAEQAATGALEEELGFPAEGFFGLPEAETPAEAPPGEGEALGEAVQPVPAEIAAAPEAEPGAEGLTGLPEEFAAPGLFEEQEAPAPAVPAERAGGQEPEARPAAGKAGPEEAPEGISEEEFSLSERRFAMLKRTLATLPRNLKMIVEELIGVQGLAGPNLTALTGLLADGAAPARIAEEVSRIIGRRVRLPRGYERLTGLAFEEERRTFAYAVRENIFPILRVAFLSLLFLGLLSFLGYRYIYRPLYANSLYRQGYVQIQKERYPLAEERFAQANAIIRYKGWYLRYAGAYAAAKQFPLAAQKYELLLKHFPLDRQGTLAYANLLTYSTFGWERAERILNDYLEKRSFKDRGVLLARGDNFLEWAGEDDQRYEQARLQYATILDHYGEQDQVLFRMMRYFIRVKPARLKETRDLYRLLEDKKDLDVPAALFASVYAELGGFWLDRGEQGDQGAYDDVKDALFKALRKGKFLPEVHYQLARYYRYLKDDREEEKALKNAITLLEDAQPQTKKRQVALIEAYTRLGESFYRRREYLEAERSFNNAIALIEQKQQQRILALSSLFGRAYLDRGDMYYYVSRDLRTARVLYDNAERNGYRSPELDYKIGYLDYFEGRYEEALLRFARVVDSRGGSENALFSLANALYYQGFYSSAQGYYLRLLDLLEIRKARIPFLQVAENPEHRNLIEFLMKVYNNLGVTYRSLSVRSRDPDKEAKALVNLTFSSEYFDQLTRDPDSAERGITRNLAFLNQRGILYPAQPFQLQLYDRIPLDLEATVF